MSYKEKATKAFEESVKEVFQNNSYDPTLHQFLSKQIARKIRNRLISLGCLLPEDPVRFSVEMNYVVNKGIVITAKDNAVSLEYTIESPEKETPQPLYDVYNPKTIQEFRDTGLLFHVNQILHPFGWVISLNTDEEGNEELVPARVRYRGFDHKAQSEQHIKIANYLAANAFNFPADIAHTGPNNPNNADPETTD